MNSRMPSTELKNSTKTLIWDLKAKNGKKKANMKLNLTGTNGRMTNAHAKKAATAMAIMELMMKVFKASVNHAIDTPTKTHAAMMVFQM